MERIRYLTVAALAGVMVVLAYQNLHDVNVNFLAWRFQASVALLALVSFLAGLLVGMLAGVLGVRARARGRRVAAEEEETHPAELGDAALGDDVDADVEVVGDAD